MRLPPWAAWSLCLETAWWGWLGVGCERLHGGWEALAVYMFWLPHCTAASLGICVCPISGACVHWCRAAAWMAVCMSQ